MTEQKAKTRKSRKKVESQEEAIAKARKRRLALAKDKTPEPDKSDSREDFRKYFVRLNKKLNLDRYMEEVIWIHLKTIKCDSKDLFDKGIKHFGYKI